ncbi:putative transposase [Parvibaculum indicum]|uniref:RNA-guided endonuclease InsQ/TnpB family protein n=1 Tax=Parvibaculum indicum TaxID=562969 RepID=UPI001420FF18|nr:RNA-guided endonuclease TnpB family protein [Parvibaculum indicum]NIJ40577.1 putative transposase [Parvibaculum indicum]
MHVNKAYRFRIYPNKEQEVFFARVAGCCRFVYNLGLEQRRVFGRPGRGFTYITQQNQLPALKKEAEWLAEVPSHTLQMALRALDRAFVNFFEGRAAYPQPRRKFENDSFTFPDPNQIRIDFGRSLLILPKLGRTKRDNGPVAIRQHRRLKGTLRSVTIAREGEHWYASILMRVRVKAPTQRRDNPVGVDRGVDVPFMTSDALALGQETETNRMRERECRLARTVSRRKKGSRNRAKALNALRRHKSKMVRRRRNATHKATAALAKNHGIIVVEDLKVANMTASAKGSVETPGRNVRQKAGLNRSILDKGWGEFVRQLEYKLGWTAGVLIKVDPAYTSQTCPACGVVDPASRITRDCFVCRSCGHADHADVVGAKEILRRGLEKLAAQGIILPGGGHPLAACGELGVTRSMKQEETANRLEILEVAV